MVRRAHQLLASGSLAVVLLLAGCATPGGPQAPATVVPPVALKPASIIGAEETSTMFDNFTVYVSAVDGQPAGSGRAGWNVPVPLPAGPRRVQLSFARGVFTARAELAFTARPGAAYRVRFSTDAQVFGHNSYCEFAIVDAATGEPVGPATRSPLARVEPAK